MFCKKCGSQIYENEQYCRNCGEKINNLENTNSKNYKLTLNRKKNFVGSLVKFSIYIDNQLVGKIKNGQILELEVSSGNHQISINKNNSVSININKDTTADIEVFGPNNFGISNINGETINNTINNDNNYIIKNEKSTNSVLIASIVIPTISVIMFFNISYYIAFWVYGLVIGYAIVNISGLKNQKGSENYKKLLTKNIISIIISAIMLVITVYITIYFS